ncbi:unnamed protein product [Menidia menidia]|uniref:(Atlantic silverside) hypothetical protein n=1 Tax=Menidia menidia TaxID=238744 RepID=A0A8S4AGV1_9TELE|nr:unnamed protein product [Menidia menidia]
MAQRSDLYAPLALLVFGLVGILLLTIPSENVQEAPEFMYGIVLDAGSSHTALYIYKWPGDKQNGTGVVTQHSHCHVKGGGISSYADQKGKAGQSLQACLDQALKDIPKDRHKMTPVYLGATAGMRLLNGQEEGAYGWVTVNYLLENFIKYGFVGHWLSPNRPTVGALDFGGASTQITFATQEPIEHEEDIMKLRLYGQDYSLYTHSFLCYGKDQFLKRLLAHLIKSQGYSQSVTHPCYPADYSKELEMDSVFGSPCTAQNRPSSYKPDAHITVQGSGHFEHCLGNVSEMFSFDICPYAQCSFNKVFQPSITGGFMAFSAFFYIHSFLKQITGITVSTPQQLEEASKSVCSLSFSHMMLQAPDQKSRLQDYCASSVFVMTLLLRGYGFNDTSFTDISFQEKAGGTSMGWALGYMLSLSNLLPEEKVGLRRALTPGAWGTLIVLFVMVLATTPVLVLFQIQKRRKKHGGEDTI